MDAKQIGFLELLNGQCQYVVPRWQRRYSWGEAEIERLIEDLLTVAVAAPEVGHYGGTLLTFQEPGPAGVVTTIRVVDGQQRLTTVSILLACIADKLGSDGHCDQWTAQIIRDDRLINPGKPPEQCRKLRLQAGDEEEYRDVLAGNPTGAGAVTQACKTIRRWVARKDVDVAHLLRGLERLRVVSIGLNRNEDPQQIFESINATGRPLTESEKVKNWLLIGLPDEQQRELHDTCWLEIERVLGAQHTTAPIDTFLRDFLRWRTGEVHGIDKVYEGFRRWAVKQGRATARPSLLHELARQARLYGILTGTVGEHPNGSVERRLRHLRAIGIDIHRPLSLRLLNDAGGGDAAVATDEGLAQVLGRIGAWLTRLWLADRPTAGLNKAIVDLAHGPGLGEGEEFEVYWLDQISALRNSRVAVPNDEEIREGVRTRRAYGGSATITAFAILCAILEDEHKEESPPRDRLTMEHVMPQKLTDDWRLTLGEEAEDIHRRYRNRMANLVLSGDATNSRLGARGFEAKKQIYRSSTIGMTRRVAEEGVWDEETLMRRAESLGEQALRLWPWPESGQAVREGRSHAVQFRWRIGDGVWHAERTASQMVLNVAGALIARDPANAQRLSGGRRTVDLQPSSRYPAGGKVDGLVFRVVPGNEDFVLCPYGGYSTSTRRCREMGERCGVKIEIGDVSQSIKFWRFLKDRTGGVPGQRDEWRGLVVRTSPLNSAHDAITIRIGSDLLRLCIETSGSSRSQDTSERMREYSWKIQDFMSDQELDGNPQEDSKEGKSIAVQRHWTFDDEDEWADAVFWIKEQQERLAAILVQG